MKKLLVLCSLLCLLVGCTSTSSQTESKSDAVKFKELYESHNGEYDDQRGHDYIEVQIDEENPVVFASEKEFFDLIDEGKSGIVYFAFPECPYCRTLIPTLLTALKDANVERLYYVNNRETRDVKELNEKGEVVTKQEGNADYYKLLEYLGDWANEYEGLNDPSIKHLYYPTVVFINSGEIVDIHVGALDSSIHPDIWEPLTDDERSLLYDTMVSKIGKVYGQGCNILAPACD